jgi:pimeloyl-ACP methyl ester carboxylesterase
METTPKTGSMSWNSWVQPDVAKTTRVYTYDRAGMGYSEAGPLPRNAKQFGQELHTLLQRAGIPAPYVLVGHSLGGLPVRVFAHEYAADVAGAECQSFVELVVAGLRERDGIVTPPARIIIAPQLIRREAEVCAVGFERGARGEQAIALERLHLRMQKIGIETHVAPFSVCPEIVREVLGGIVPHELVEIVARAAVGILRAAEQRCVAQRRQCRRHHVGDRRDCVGAAPATKHTQACKRGPLRGLTFALPETERYLWEPHILWLPLLYAHQGNTMTPEFTTGILAQRAIMRR